MKTSCYLIVNKKGDLEFRKSSYSLKLGEVAIKINISLPDSIFSEPTLEGSLTLTEEQAKDRRIKELEFELKNQGE